MRTSTGEYPANWDEIAKEVKDLAGWKCVRCKHHHDIEAGYMLTVHHLDLNKSNCHWWNIPALCQRCHLTIQGKVIIERPWMFEHSDWFKPYVAGYYAFTYGLPDDRPTVELHLKALILIGQGIQPPDLQRTQNTPLELSNGAKASANRRTGEIPV